jgi:hypothetical protein
MRRDNFLSFAFQLNKDGTLYKSPAKSHCLPIPRENALSGVASVGKNSGLPLNPLPLFGEKAIASWVSLAASLDNQQC